MNILKLFLIGIFLLLTFSPAIAQEKNDLITYNFKKGEILDILLLTNKPDITSLFSEYRKTVFPVGVKHSFKPVPGLPIVETTQGGLQPEAMIFGKWDSKKKRKEFLKTIVQVVPDFHEQRRAIWAYFSLTYYEIPKETIVTIDRSKCNVVTSYWGEGTAFDIYIKTFKKATAQNGGKEVITLTNGDSPVGYVYNPDYLTITEWESKATFDAFYKKYQALQEESIENVHQFVLK